MEGKYEEALKKFDEAHAIFKKIKWGHKKHETLALAYNK